MSEQDSDLRFLCMESGLSQEAQMLAEMIPFLNGVFCSWLLCSSPKVLAELLGHVHMSIIIGADGFVPTVVT